MRGFRGVSTQRTTAGWVDFDPSFVPDHAATMETILAEVTLRQETTHVFGKTYDVPRLTAWIGDAGRLYSFGGKTFEPTPWTPTLEALRARVSAHEGVEFNSVLVNLYRDGSDSVAFHADDEPELGPSPDDIRIASISLGAARRFRVKGPVISDAWNLGAGSLLVMGGTLQRDHVHSIPKTRKPVDPRVNLTFRVVA